MLVLGLLFRFVSKYAEYGVSKLICGIYNQGRVSTIKAHVLCRLCLRCFHTTANAKVCLFSVRNAVDPRPCLLNAKLIDRTITVSFCTYKLRMSAKISEIGYLFPVICRNSIQQ